MKRNLWILTILVSCLKISAQEVEIPTLAEKACECLYKIDLNIPKSEQYNEVNSCITSAILAQQLETAFNEIPRKKDSLINSQADSTKNVRIELKTDKDYKEIEKYLLRNCPSMKRIMSSDNSNRETSMSKNKKALEHYDKGQEYFEGENYGNAIVEFSKAVKKDKNFVFAWDNLGLSYRRNGQFKPAIDAYEKSLKINPMGRMPLMNIPIVYELMGNHKKAIQGYENFISRYPGDPEGFYGVGRIYFSLEDYENALDNMFSAFLLYKKQNSPYIHDAEVFIRDIYKAMQKKGQVGLFNKIADKHNINIKK